MNTSQKHDQNSAAAQGCASLGEKATRCFIDKDLHATPSTVRGLQGVATAGAVYTFVANYVVSGWQGWLSTVVAVIIYTVLTSWVVKGLERRNGTARMVGYFTAIMFTLGGMVGIAMGWGNSLAVGLSVGNLLLGVAWFYFDSRRESKAHFAPDADNSHQVTQQP